MKFYVLYQQTFPLGFGLAAALCVAIALWGFGTRKPLVFPFLVSLLSWIGILVPLFLLALNHFLVAWPLDPGAAILNGAGVLGPPVIIAALWFSRFDLTTVGAPAAVVKQCVEVLRSQAGAEAEKTVCFALLKGSICFLRIPSENAAAAREFRKSLAEMIASRLPRRNLAGPCFCLFTGIVCAIVASISWCTSTHCWAPL